MNRLTLRSLIFLGLLRDDGMTTDKFKALRYATDEDYGTVLSEIVTAAYTNIIAAAPPAVSTRLQLMNAFRPYSPASQRDRMVTLFLSLCKEAGMEVKEPAKDSSTRPPTASGGAVKPKPKPSPPTKRLGEETNATDRHQPNPLDPLIAALVGKLPPPGSAWATSDRDEWVSTFQAAAKMVWTL